MATAAKKPGRTPLDFQVAIKRKEPIPFTLPVYDEEKDVLTAEKETYSWVPQKNALMVMPTLGDGGEVGAMNGMFDWLESGLSEEHASRLRARLALPGDPVDIDTLGDIIQGLVSEVSGRPTT